MITFEELTTPATAEQVEETIMSVATALGLRVTSWDPKGITRTLIKIMARSIAVYSQLISDIARAPFLGYARGPWLYFLAKYNYGVTRYAAGGAGGFGVVTNARAVTLNYAAGDLVVQNPSTGETFRNVMPYSSAGLDTVSVAFLAENVGAKTTSQPGQVSHLVTSIVGVTVTNPLAWYGVDEETDAALTERARLARSALSPNGAFDAYRFVLTSPELNPTTVPITRVITRPSYGTAHTITYCATAAGTPSAGDIVVCRDSVAKHCEPQGVITEVYGAIPVSVSIVCTVTVENETLKDAEIVAAVTKAASDYLNSLPIGGKVVYPSTTGRMDYTKLSAKIDACLPSIVDTSLTTPGADVPAAPTDVFQIGMVSVTVVRT